MALSPVVIEFMSRGVPNVQQAFRTIVQTVVDSERTSTRAVATGARSKEREYQKLTQQIAREAASSAKAETRAAQQAARDKVAAWKSGDREVARARAAGAREAAQAARAEVRAFESAERDKTRIVRAESRSRDRERSRTAGRVAETIVGAAAGAGRSLVRGATGLATTVLGAGGGFSVQDSLSREISLRGQAATLSASASLAGGKQFTSEQILSRARAVGNTEGFDPNEVMESIGKMKDLTGDLGRALEMAPRLAQLANATGGNMKEFGELAGNISASSPKMSNDDIMKVVRIQAAQGAVGAVEVADMAKYGSRLTAGASYYGGDRTKNIAMTSAMAQMARQHGSASTPAEAALASQRFGSDVMKHADKLEGMGIKVRDGKGTLLDAGTIIQQMMAKTGGDVTKLSGLGIGDRGGKVLEGAASIYREAGGGADGQKALDAYLGKLVNAVASDKQIDDASRKRVAEVDKQVTIAMNQLRDTVGTELAPEFIKLLGVIKESTPQIKAMLQAFVSMVAWAKDNPIKTALIGLGAMMTKTIAAELISAKIGDTIKSILMRGGPGGGPGTGSKVGEAAGAGMLAGVLTYTAVKPGVDAVLQGQTSGQAQAGAYISDLKRGGPRADSAIADLEKMKGKYTGVAGALEMYGAATMTPLNSVYSAITGEDNKSAQDLSKAVAAREVLGNDQVQQLVSKRQEELAASTGRAADAMTKAAIAFEAAANTAGVVNPASDTRNKPLNMRGGTQ